MQIIKIEAFESGAHANQTINCVIVPPKGWAIVPDDMEIPESFPFVDIEVEQQEDGYFYVAKMTAREVPTPEPIEEQPSQLDIIEAQVTYTAMMTDTLLEV